MKDRIANAEFAGSLFGQYHQPLGQSLATVLRLHEDVEDVGAAMVGRMARMRRPVDDHHAETRDHDACVFEHPAEIAAVIESR